MNNNEVATKQEHSVTFGVNGEDVTLTANTVRNYLVDGGGRISDQEVAMFINLCKFQHLNPFLKEAYIIKFGSQPAQLITSKEAFMKRAENHPQYAGIKAGAILLRNNEVVYSNGAFALRTDKVVGGWADVFRKDRKEPHRVEISMQEFSKGQSTWNTMPATMIRKTAIVNALREAFPEALGGMYTEDDKNPNDPAQGMKSVEATEREQQANSILKGATNDNNVQPVNDIQDTSTEPEQVEKDVKQEDEQSDDEITEIIQGYEETQANDQEEQTELLDEITGQPKEDEQ
ncbi:phage recombination protein Bet [Ligilactobacillus salitolerans]|uniref:Phage recombination protein Bet n=1 Tax=Ligilactobacillus salitolerans TaxID=1808352 RepID=A0A401ISX3_9LACO|nr:phage recombination protein Bet [Ligilactobacillus salitolerans]GBG94621.1 phage recombination protein Bet [Ligilactobacillus salitolerans]